MTSSLQQDHCRRISTDEQQLNQQEKRTNHDNNDDDYIKVNQQAIVHSINMKENDDDGHYSDESNCSDDLRLVFFFVLIKCFTCVLSCPFELRQREKKNIYIYMRHHCCQGFCF